MAFTTRFTSGHLAQRPDGRSTYSTLLKLANDRAAVVSRLLSAKTDEE